MLLQKKIIHKKQKSKLPCHDEALSGAIVKYAFLSPNENGKVKNWDDFNVLETVYKSSMHLEVFKRRYQIVAKSSQSVVGRWRRSGSYV